MKTELEAKRMERSIKPMTASEMGKLGAQARIRATTSDQRKAWARKAGKASGKARRKKIKPYFEPKPIN